MKAAKAKFDEPHTFEPTVEFSRFVNPATAIVRFDDRKKINMPEWGLIADWVKQKLTQKMQE